jgi:glycosyltransferase involved in cell wall biosynthesis
MNILIANWAWYPSGGDWTYIETISHLYRSRGHQVIPFSMKDDRNLPTEYSDFFIENINYREINAKKNIGSAVKVLEKSIYSAEAIDKLERLLAIQKVDVAHLNLIHHYITPAVLKVFKKHRIPVIWTLHDYTILCPQSTFISHDKICERCRGGSFYHCAVQTCKKGSFAASSVAAMESYVYSYLNYYKDVDTYICPSAFSYNKYRSFGFFPEKLKHIYHTYRFVAPPAADTTKQETRYIIFVGRLEKIKGVYTLLEAMRSNPHVHLKIAGDGTEELNLQNYIVAHSLNNVKFMGKLTKQEVLLQIRDSEFMICPSEWYEVLGFTIFEAMLMGKAVIGSRIGAIPESVINEQTGLLFEPGNAAELAGLIQKLYGSPDLARMSQNARAHIQTIIDEEKFLRSMQEVIPGL